MFRRIGLILLVMGACALLQGETLFAGITNGSFDSNLDGWTSVGVVRDGFYQAAYFGELNGDISLSTSNPFAIQSGDTLSFDFLLSAGGGETEYFYAFLTTGPIEGPTVVGPIMSIIEDPDRDQLFSFCMDSEGTPYTADGVSVGPSPIATELFPWERVRILFTSDLENVTLHFLLTSQDPETSAEVYLDNVAIVPEPATMTLGLIGVGIVGAIRRRGRK